MPANNNGSLTGEPITQRSRVLLFIGCVQARGGASIYQGCFHLGSYTEEKTGLNDHFQHLIMKQQQLLPIKDWNEFERQCDDE